MLNLFDIHGCRPIEVITNFLRKVWLEHFYISTDPEASNLVVKVVYTKMNSVRLQIGWNDGCFNIHLWIVAKASLQVFTCKWSLYYHPFNWLPSCWMEKGMSNGFDSRIWLLNWGTCCRWKTHVPIHRYHLYQIWPPPRGHATTALHGIDWTFHSAHIQQHYLHNSISFHHSFHSWFSFCWLCFIRVTQFSKMLIFIVQIQSMVGITCRSTTVSLTQQWTTGFFLINLNASNSIVQYCNDSSIHLRQQLLWQLLLIACWVRHTEFIIYNSNEFRPTVQINNTVSHVIAKPSPH